MHHMAAATTLKKTQMTVITQEQLEILSKACEEGMVSYVYHAHLRIHVQVSRGNKACSAS